MKRLLVLLLVLGLSGVAEAASLAALINPEPQLRKRAVFDSAYDCDVDPMGLGWSHLNVVVNHDDCTPTCDPYTLHADDEYSAGDTTVDFTGSSVANATAAQSGGFGCDSTDSSGRDSCDLAENAFDVIGEFEGRVGFYVNVKPGGGVDNNCVQTDIVGAWGASPGTLTYLELRNDTAGSGPWDARFNFNDGAANFTTISSDKPILEAEFVFVELIWNADGSSGLDDNAQDYAAFEVGGVEKGRVETALGGQGALTLFVWGSADACRALVDDVWSSDHPLFDIYNHVVVQGCVNAPAGI